MKTFWGLKYGEWKLKERKKAEMPPLSRKLSCLFAMVFAMRMQDTAARAAIMARMAVARAAMAGTAKMAAKAARQTAPLRLRANSFI